jgi:hypothetical protein
VHFNLEEREVFKLLVEFQAIFKWQESIKSEEVRELDTVEVIAFYNNLEEILLNAWGVPSEDGLYFRKGGRYDFEESKLFAAVMKMFVEDPKEANALLDGLMPKGLQDMVKKADANMADLAKNPDTDAELRRQIDELRSQLASKPDNVGTEPTV